MRVIGITGPANSGKDSLKDIILELNPEWETYSFAGPLKMAIQAIFGWTAEQIEDRVFKETVDPFWGVSPRQAMQKLGTEYGRDMIHPDIWIKRADLFLKQNQDKQIIIPDVRFENEAEWVRRNGVLIHIERPGASTTEFAHSSEAGVYFDSQVDLTIPNTGTLDDLFWIWMMLEESLNM